MNKWVFRILDAFPKSDSSSFELTVNSDNAVSKSDEEFLKSLLLRACSSNTWDSKEKAKSESRDWLNNTVSELESQIDSFEAEMEGLSVKKGKTRPLRLTHLESSIARIEPNRTEPT